MILDAVRWVSLVPCDLCGGVGGEVIVVYCIGLVKRRVWNVWADGHWLEDRVVGGVTDGGLCEYFDEVEECGEEYVPSAEVSDQCVDEAEDFNGVFLGRWSPFDA